MKIRIIGAESLGVRGLFCVVQTKSHKIIIDPGVALGLVRHRLLPHPIQVAASELVKERIISELSDATDVVFSHYHGDHIPLVSPNPYQLPLKSVLNLMQRPRLWAKSPDGLSLPQRHHSSDLFLSLRREPVISEDSSYGPLSFSKAVPHGKLLSQGGTVMMTRIQDGDEVFVHASDIQLLNDEAVEIILEWRPTIVLASGPPLYLAHLSEEDLDLCWQRAIRLAIRIDTLILDHHLLRSHEGIYWLDALKAKVKRRVLCAADLMGGKRLLLEANRSSLYQRFPVPEGWHNDYALGRADATPWRGYIANM